MDIRVWTKMLAMPYGKVAARAETEKFRPLLQGSSLLASLVSGAIAWQIKLKDGSSLYPCPLPRPRGPS